MENNKIGKEKFIDSPEVLKASMQKKVTAYKDNVAEFKQKRKNEIGEKLVKFKSVNVKYL